jgi:hypothetical protein
VMNASRSRRTPRPVSAWSWKETSETTSVELPSIGV